MINRLENEISAMNERFGHEQIYKNPDLLACLQHDFDAKTAELDLLYRAYERRTQ